ncbi:MAG: DUF11 domain-containing protein, partial [Acidobacteriota bacterium]
TAAGASSQVSFVVDVDPGVTATLSNTATVSGNEADPNSSNNADTETTGVAASTDLALAKSDSQDPAIAGSQLTYTLEVTNGGPSSSTGATVEDALPTGTSFVSSADGCTVSEGVVSCPIPGTAVGGSASASFVVEIDPGVTASLSNTATVASNETDANPSNNSATEGTAIRAEADLSLTKTDGQDPVEQTTFAYTLEVGNAGPSDATGVLATDTLPSALTFVSSADGCTESMGVVTCSFGALEAGATATAVFEVSFDPLTAPATVLNTATVSSSDSNLSDPDSGNNSDQEETTLDGEAPTVTALLTPAGPLDAACPAIGLPLAELSLTFSEPMADPAGDSEAADVTNPSNYLLISPGPNRVFDTALCGALGGDDTAAGTAQTVVYDGASQTARVLLAQPIQGGLVRLLACAAGLTDAAGNALDGNGDGSGGDDFSATLRVDAGNLLEDGSFDCGDLAAWTPVVTNPAEAVWSAEDFQGSAESGSAALTNLTASQTFRLEQCVDAVAGGEAYTWRARTRLAAAASPELALGCDFFDAAACAGGSLGTVEGTASLADTAGAWPQLFSGLEAPAGSASALCFAELRAAGGESFDLNLDALRLEIGAAPLFADDFESGTSAAWSRTEP